MLQKIVAKCKQTLAQSILTRGGENSNENATQHIPTVKDSSNNRDEEPHGTRRPKL